MNTTITLRAAIVRYAAEQAKIDHSSRAHQVAGVMLGVCDDIIAGRYGLDDPNGRSLVKWAEANGLFTA